MTLHNSARSSIFYPTDGPESSMPLDIRMRAVDLACRLSSLQFFLDAAFELQGCKDFIPSDFRRHCRKIIRLIEIARATLTKAGITLHAFTSCPKTMAPYKAAYFQLLQVLKVQRHNVEPDLRGRINRLLLPLSTHMVIRAKGDPPLNPFRYITFPNGGPHASQAAGSTAVPKHAHRRSTMESMPAPDEFPVSDGKGREHQYKIRFSDRDQSSATLFPPNSDSRPPRYSFSPSPESDLDVLQQPVIIRRPLRRRFGIFCTKKNSMFEFRDAGGYHAPSSTSSQ